MSSLAYSILRYFPSLVSGEVINLAAVFYYYDDSDDYREFYRIKNWNRVKAFDDSVDIGLLKDVLLDINDEVGTPLSNPNFNLQKLCGSYHNELRFSDIIELYDVISSNISEEIERIKHIYFSSEFNQNERPRSEEQKKFLSRILRSKQIKFTRNGTRVGRFNETIHYDYVFDGYGVKFFDLNKKKTNGITLNNAKTWAWNSINAPDGLKTVILYDLSEENQDDAQSILSILRSSADYVISLSNGYSGLDSII